MAVSAWMQILTDKALTKTIIPTGYRAARAAGSNNNGRLKEQYFTGRLKFILYQKATYTEGAV